MKVPYVDLITQHAPLKKEILDAISGVLDSGQLILGEQVRRFEEEFANLCGCKYAVGVNSGTDALVLSLRALGIGPGDEVITAPNSFVATASAIALVGARPVFVDVRPDMNIDPDQVEHAITPRTRALLPVHLTGKPADMHPLSQIANRHDLTIVEDAAQAVFAGYHGRRVGSLGTAGCFSLHPLKTLNACGDGGVVTTSDEILYQRLLLLRNLGLQTRDNCVVWSGNSRLDEIQAAILLVKLKYLLDWTRRRQANAAYYSEYLSGIPGLTLPIHDSREEPVFHTFIIRTGRRDDLRDHLARNGVGSAVHYPIPIHLQDVARELGYKAGDFPEAERQASRILSLPVHHSLRQDQLEHVVSVIREFFDS
jgi:dTDP-4-amino-4,6-dideoxygalactose transaminase